MLGKPMSVVRDTTRYGSARNDSDNWSGLDDPAETLLWMLLLQNPEVTVDADTNTVSGVDNDKRHLIELYKGVANENKNPIPSLNYTTYEHTSFRP